MATDRSSSNAPSPALGDREREAYLSPAVDFFLVMALCAAFALAGVALIVP